VSEANAQNALNRIEDENIVGQVQSLLQAARSDSSSAIDCEHRLLALAAAIDDVEDAIKVPTLVEEAQTIQRSAQEIVSQNGTAEEKHGLGLLKGELEKVITSRDPDLIRQRMEAVSGLSFQVLIRQPGFWVGYLQYLEEQKTIMRDSAMADQLIAQGNRAIANQDIEALKAAVRQLIGLLPTAQQGIARGYDGTTVKK
jgi:hypothetical protein